MTQRENKRKASKLILESCTLWPDVKILTQSFDLITVKNDERI